MYWTKYWNDKAERLQFPSVDNEIHKKSYLMEKKSVIYGINTTGLKLTDLYLVLLN